MTDILSGNETWEQLYASLASRVDLDGLAAETGALLRRRRIRDLASLLRLALTYANEGGLRTTAAWAAQMGIAELSDVALLKRLRRASDWLIAVASALLPKLDPAKLDPAELDPAEPIAASHRLRVIDASCISMPGSSGTDWRLHAVFDPVQQRFVDFDLTDAKGGEGFEHFTVAPGEIWLGDRGYIACSGLQHVLDGGAELIVRAGWNAFRLLEPDGGEFNLFETLRETGTHLDCPIVIEDRRKKRLLSDLRLVAWRKTPEATAKDRLRIRREAKRKGKTPDPRSLEAAQWVILVTSLNPASFPTDTILAMYRWRWQIEIAFKRLKSLAHLDALPIRAPALARAWIGAKLISAILIEQSIQEFLESPPCADGTSHTSTFGLAPLPVGL